MPTLETDVHELIRDSVRDLAADFDSAYWREHVEEKRFPQEYWEALADNGWLGVAIDEEYGGEGMEMHEMAMVIEELARGGGQGGIIFILTPVFGGISIQRHGTDEQKSTYLPQIVDGEMKFCMGLTEANAGTNTLSIETSASRDGDEFVIHGEKTFISSVETADEMLLVARTSPFDPSNPVHGGTLFLVSDPAERDAISLSTLDTAVPWFEHQYQVSIDGLRVHEDDVLGSVDDGFKLMFDTLNTERIAGAASALGGGLRAVDLAVDYANDRDVFGQPIGSHQSIQHPLAESYAKLTAARELTYSAAAKWDAGEDCSMETNAAKLLTSEFSTEAASRAIQAHGGNGFTEEYEVYKIWQNSRLTQTVPVSNEMAKNHIAEHHLGLPRSY
ncbi:acyl-CoA dehydrogenase family protein [Natronolimnohabitans innermongolicus]|uniref:Acyl-CoA dehydrogenase 3 n=1 Tax=Natronolimnohabitans innermongolicus JCM 12255 TaxID=1227499 RepID=L9WLQ6_9EURY|nr:acyl-CoA dehydrogenase family protein [Natronolimnohabitans innermongolicus]ELY50410.1 acyl-CoA dehydrogenase 3 [Natronolimnohabitans innermongolicus JCM 12255]